MQVMPCIEVVILNKLFNLCGISFKLIIVALDVKPKYADVGRYSTFLKSTLV